jgi:molybdenum cofactor synthesis domain-containing protein
MPREGTFARVINEGHVKEGDCIAIEMPSADSPFTAAVVTLSDKGYRGEREDLSGPLIAEMLDKAGYKVIENVLIPDEKDWLKRELIRLSDGRQASLVLTTGGTGFSERDITPEATIEVCDRLARGIVEAIRAYSMTITKRAMLSRAESGIRGKTLIVNLPGSPKAVRESLEYILPELSHGLAILRGTESECGGK